MNGVHIHVSAIAAAHSALLGLAKPVDLGEADASDQQVVDDAPFRIEHVAPEKSDDDGRQHHRHHQEREDDVATAKISLQLVADEDPEQHLQRDAEEDELAGEDEALPELRIGQEERRSS